LAIVDSGFERMWLIFHGENDFPNVDDLNSHRRKLKQLKAQLIQFEVDNASQTKNGILSSPKRVTSLENKSKGVTIRMPGDMYMTHRILSILWLKAM